MVFQENKTQEMFENAIAALLGIEASTWMAAYLLLDDRQESMKLIKKTINTAERQRMALIEAMHKWQRAGKPDFLNGES